MAHYYRIDNAFNEPVMEARASFLKAIQRKCPHVLNNLRDAILPKYFEALPHIPKDAQLLTWEWFDKNSDQRTPELCALRKAMHFWAGRHNLSCDWIMDTAWITIHLYEYVLQCREGPNVGEIEYFGGKPEWSLINLLGVPSSFKPDAPAEPPGRLAVLDLSSALHYLAFDERVFVYFTAPWEPFYVSWDKFEAEARQGFERSLKGHKSNIEAMVRSDAGCRPVPVKRDETHYEWAAMYRCSEPIATLQQICSKYPSVNDRSTIKHGIESVEKFIGLPPLHRPPGRRSSQ